MAEKTKNVAVPQDEVVEKVVKNEAAKPQKEMVEIRIPRTGKEDSLLVGVNFKNYYIKRGEWVKVPKEVAEVIRNSEAAAEQAEEYARAKEDAYLEKASNPTKLK